ncbi:MAG: GNAT family N-acetyltransferase [Oscillospiraceae bacterium]|nr:GNAT family N-acetyltransferase [Oscillospiraceae bacterium]
MQVRRFNLDMDLQNLEDYLRNQYLVNKNMTSWLPERLHDLIYRVSVQEADGGREKSVDYIFLWEERGEIVACILPDGENIYISIKNGFEQMFPSVLAYSEENCLPLFHKVDDGSVKFWVAVSDSLSYMQKILQDSGYARYPEEDYDNYVRPLETSVSVDLPKGFRLLYGEDYTNETNKWTALHLGFHPDHEVPGYITDMQPYMSRKSSTMYQDSFECLVIDENSEDRNDVCAYCFVYVDKQSQTALIEPVSTREKYRRKGIGTALMHGVMLRCKERGVDKCYVNSFGWRKKFYNAAGFITEETIGFWYKTLR